MTNGWVFFFSSSKGNKKKTIAHNFKIVLGRDTDGGGDTEQKKKYEPKRFLILQGTQIQKRGFREEVSRSINRVQDQALEDTKGGRSYRALAIDGSGT